MDDWERLPGVEVERLGVAVTRDGKIALVVDAEDGPISLILDQSLARDVSLGIVRKLNECAQRSRQ